jgi:hypothetical protein
MKNRILTATLTCLAGMLCAVSFACATECSIIPSSISWNQNDQTTWKSGVYQLTVACTDKGVPVAGYQAEFSIALMEGAAWENRIAELTVYSTPTDSDGIAYINVPLIHEKKDDGTYIHICPFDDIQAAGGSSSLSQAAPANFSKAAPRTSSSTGGICYNTNPLPGCCETTITITCCTPNRVFSYCTQTFEECISGTTYPDECTTITTTWTKDGTCNYCTGICEPHTVITLSSFTAKPGNDSVTLNWKTETETDNVGFNILRAESENGAYVKMNTVLIPSKADAAGGASYQFIDSTAKNRKTYYYKLEDIDLNDAATQHGPQSTTPKWIYSFWK